MVTQVFWGLILQIDLILKLGPVVLSGKVLGGSMLLLEIDTIFYCARACRKEHPRRDQQTVLLDTKGIVKTFHAFPNARVFYCSTKVVDGWTDDWERPISRKEIGDYFERALEGAFQNEIIHLPEQNKNEIRHKNPLSQEHTLYANTKSIGELLVKSCAKDYTIFRIWDITQ